MFAPKKIGYFVVLAVALTAIAGPVSATECFGSGTYHLTSAGPWPMTIATAPGSSCSRTLYSGGTMSYKRLLLVSGPEHGTISVKEGGYYTYTPAAGFRGIDHFQLRLCGKQGPSKAALTCNIRQRFNEWWSRAQNHLRRDL